LELRILKRPRNVGGDAQDVGVVAVGGAFIDKGSIGFPTPILLLLRGEPLLGPEDKFRVHFIDLRHIVELHQPISGQNFICRRLAEPRKSSAGNFKRQQPLIAVGDISFGLGVYFGS
jgi:hypothetical protein